MNELKILINEFLKTRKITVLPENLHTTNIESTKIDDISDSSLLLLSLIFFKNYMKEKKCFNEYFETVEYLQIVDNEFKKTKITTLENLFWERNEKIRLNLFVKDFLSETIDFESREWILEFLKYLYVICIEEMLSQKNIEKMKRSSLKDNVSMKIYKIEPKNNRSDLLKRYNKPSLSLDDYADMVIDSMKRFEAANKNEEVIVKIDEEEERKNEEKKDESHFGSGNRRNFG